MAASTSSPNEFARVLVAYEAFKRTKLTHQDLRKVGIAWDIAWDIVWVANG